MHKQIHLKREKKKLLVHLEFEFLGYFRNQGPNLHCCITEPGGREKENRGKMKERATIESKGDTAESRACTLMTSSTDGP